MSQARVGCCLCVLLVAAGGASASAEAQVPGAQVSGAQVSGAQVSGVPGEGWRRVEALPPGTRVRIETDTRKTTCHLVSVSHDQISCPQQSFAATAIRSVKLQHRGRSAGYGALIGGGAGAGIGAGVGMAIKGSFFVSSDKKAGGVGAAFFGLVGAGAGALIGHATDFSGGALYRR